MNGVEICFLICAGVILALLAYSYVLGKRVAELRKAHREALNLLRDAKYDKRVADRRRDAFAEKVQEVIRHSRSYAKRRK